VKKSAWLGHKKASFAIERKIN